MSLSALMLLEFSSGYDVNTGFIRACGTVSRSVVERSSVGRSVVRRSVVGRSMNTLSVDDLSGVLCSDRADCDEGSVVVIDNPAITMVIGSLTADLPPK